MKRLVLLLLLLPQLLRAQVAPDSVIRVVLVGTFHFGATTDRNSTAFPDLFSKRRQQELDRMAQALARLQPTKIFIEREPRRQRWVDSLYALYQRRQLRDSARLRDEIVQLAYRTAARVPAARLVAADYKEELPYAQVEAYGKAHPDEAIYPFFNTPYPFGTERKKLSDSTLLEYYLQINSPEAVQRSLYDYLHYAMGYGRDTTFVGARLTSVWYDRNLKIFNNILRGIDPRKDRTVLVLFGSGHTAVLRQFFASHPRFQLVELTTVLN
jgi:hypothetical protein